MTYEEDLARKNAAQGKKVFLGLISAILVILVLIIVFYTPSKITYKQTQSGIWFQEKSKDYTCPQAPGIQTQGDWVNYCIFTQENDAKNACSADATCIGYGEVADGSMFQLTRLPPVANSSVNGKFFSKQSS